MSAPIDDLELEDLLVSRADRARGDDAELLHAVANRMTGVRQDRPGWATPRLLRGDQRLGWMASVAAALAIGIAIGLVGPELMRPGSTASSVPSPGASVSSALPTPTGPVSSASPIAGPRDDAPIPFEVLTARDLALRMAVGRLGPGVVIVDGRMVADPLCGSQPGGGCRYALLEGLPGLALLGDGYLQGQFSAPAGGRIALLVTDEIDGHARSIALVLAEHIIKGDEATGAFSVAGLLGIRGPVGGWGPETGFVVEGWLLGTDETECSAQASYGYGCGPATWLSDSADRSSGKSMRVQSDAYGTFAPEPDGEGAAAVPRRGVYLVNRSVVHPCGPGLRCGPVRDPGAFGQWGVRGTVAAAPVRSTVAPMTTAQLAADLESLDGQTVIVDGEMVAAPLPCPSLSAPGDCTGGRLIGLDGPPILPHRDVFPDWTGRAAGFLAFTVRGTQLTYLGEVHAEDTSITVRRPSMLFTAGVGDGELILVQGDVVHGCPEVPACSTAGIRDAGTDDILMGIGWGTDPVAGGSGSFLLRFRNAEMPCTSAPGATGICIGPLVTEWWFVAWVPAPPSPSDASG
jgi:hypothetical protein